MQLIEYIECSENNIKNRIQVAEAVRIKWEISEDDMIQFYQGRMGAEDANVEAYKKLLAPYQYNIKHLCEKQSVEPTLQTHEEKIEHIFYLRYIGNDKLAYTYQKHYGIQNEEISTFCTERSTALKDTSDSDSGVYFMLAQVYSRNTSSRLHCIDLKYFYVLGFKITELKYQLGLNQKMQKNLKSGIAEEKKPDNTVLENLTSDYAILKNRLDWLSEMQEGIQELSSQFRVMTKGEIDVINTVIEASIKYYDAKTADERTKWRTILHNQAPKLRKNSQESKLASIIYGEKVYKPKRNPKPEVMEQPKENEEQRVVDLEMKGEYKEADSLQASLQLSNRSIRDWCNLKARIEKNEDKEEKNTPRINELYSIAIAYEKSSSSKNRMKLSNVKLINKIEQLKAEESPYLENVKTIQRQIADFANPLKGMPYLTKEQERIIALIVANTIKYLDSEPVTEVRYKLKRELQKLNHELKKSSQGMLNFFSYNPPNFTPLIKAIENLISPSTPVASEPAEEMPAEVEMKG